MTIGGSETKNWKSSFFCQFVGGGGVRVRGYKVLDGWLECSGWFLHTFIACVAVGSFFLKWANANKTLNNGLAGLAECELQAEKIKTPLTLCYKFPFVSFIDLLLT